MMNNKPISWSLYDHNSMFQTYTLSKYRKRGYSNLGIKRLITKFKIRKGRFYWNYYDTTRKEWKEIEQKFGLKMGYLPK